MAGLFDKQAKLYAEGRPDYPFELFEFIASKTADHDLVWDVGTGSGQAAVSLANLYKNIVATDISQQQLSFAHPHPNVRYLHTPFSMPPTDVTRAIAPQGSVDLVTVAQALHWFDPNTFYQQVKWLLKKPGGVFAAWCYTLPKVNEAVDSILANLYTTSDHFWASERKLVDAEYRTLEFPFEPVEGEEHTGPFVFERTREMDLEAFLTWIRTWSAYQTAHMEGVELLSEEVVKKFEQAWKNSVGKDALARYPIFLRIGRIPM
ncbi:hypothetical protein AMTRI_Chr01g129710 [Amborella trichopoda]|uniref:Methyltransferase type 11 domain-containing protein n=1 Tax=Amborella trichopoda TaxID=13333 RepID=W1NPW5_AMBTC|nr:putative methyltransferase DDB_G0268948 [Amborella trichopoda]ERM97762.1 hypothetical protein AMTR_s00116p00046640 [Amborella trichopoda]|eukprot:XP_006830346.1 putative methyltransferase DDB_G0268948 [Amborella trichopoda]